MIQPCLVSDTTTFPNSMRSAAQNGDVLRSHFCIIIWHRSVEYTIKVRYVAHGIHITNSILHLSDIKYEYMLSTCVSVLLCCHVLMLSWLFSFIYTTLWPTLQPLSIEFYDHTTLLCNAVWGVTAITVEECPAHRRQFG